MKKFLLACLIVVLFVAGAFAAEKKIGQLSRLNVTAEEFLEQTLKDVSSKKLRVFFSGEPFEPKPVFYDSLISLQLALNAGEVDFIMLPEAVGEYVLNVSNKYEISSIVRTPPASLSFGFNKSDDPTMRNRFNEALLSMKADGTLSILIDKYIAEPGTDDPEPVKFGQYDNIETKIKVAVTGDLPPIDFIAPNGTPAGFNTAVLAEIGKRLKINIELVNIDSNARAAALAAKRVDVVFWFSHYKDLEKQFDVPDNVALSESYYSWNEDLLIQLAK